MTTADRYSGLQPGDLVANTYRIDRMLSVGGMGALYLGQHAITGESVAIKVILPSFARDKRAVGLFRREAQALKQMSHPAIVGYEAFLVDQDGSLLLIMEYVDGRPLTARLANGRLTGDAILRLGDRLVGGLAAAHASGIVHRDVSPGNVLLPGDDVGRAKLIDFGIAKRFGGEEKTLLDESFAGKIRYASPEQMGLFDGVVDSRSDMYSLGLLLAEAAGIELPGKESLMSAMEVRRADVEFPADLDAKLRRRLTKMLRADPQQRPSNIEAAWQDATPARPDAEDLGDVQSEVMPAQESTRLHINTEVATVGDKDSIGPYAVQRLLASTRTSDVFRCRDKTSGQRLAIRVLKTDVLAEQDLVNRSLNTATTLKQISHPNLVNVIEVAEPRSGPPYIVMEFVEGYALKELPKNKVLPPECVALIGLDIAQALHIAHSSGMIHRDIKPSNIIFDRNKGITKLTDFGVAKLKSGSIQTRHNMLIGTPRYMSPEQILGDKIDIRSDFFSLGATLYELLAGEEAFAGHSSALVFEQIMFGKVKGLPRLDNPISNRLCNYLEEILLAKKPDDRPGSANELVDLFSNLLGDSAGDFRQTLQSLHLDDETTPSTREKRQTESCLRASDENDVASEGRPESWKRVGDELASNERTEGQSDEVRRTKCEWQTDSPDERTRWEQQPDGSNESTSWEQQSGASNEKTRWVWQTDSHNAKTPSPWDPKSESPTERANPSTRPTPRLAFLRSAVHCMLLLSFLMGVVQVGIWMIPYLDEDHTRRELAIKIQTDNVIGKTSIKDELKADKVAVNFLVDAVFSVRMDAASPIEEKIYDISLGFRDENLMVLGYFGVTIFVLLFFIPRDKKIAPENGVEYSAIDQFEETLIGNLHELEFRARMVVKRAHLWRNLLIALATLSILVLVVLLFRESVLATSQVPFFAIPLSLCWGLIWLCYREYRRCRETEERIHVEKREPRRQLTMHRLYRENIGKDVDPDTRIWGLEFAQAAREDVGTAPASTAMNAKGQGSNNSSSDESLHSATATILNLATQLVELTKQRR